MYLIIATLSKIGKLLSMKDGTVPKGLTAKYSGFLVSTPTSTTLKSAGTSPKSKSANTALDGDDEGWKYKVI